MSRIPAVDRASADPKTLLAAVNKALGVTPNLFRVTAQSPAALEGLLKRQGTVPHHPSSDIAFSDAVNAAQARQRERPQGRSGR
jgi:hypothetical protein